MQDRYFAPQSSPPAGLVAFGQPPLQQQPRRDVDRQQQQSGSQEYQPRQVQAVCSSAGVKAIVKKSTLRPEAQAKTDG